VPLLRRAPHHRPDARGRHRTLEAVIAHEPAPRPKSGIGLDDALASLKGAEARRAERFKEELKSQEKKPQILDKMFKEGIKKAKDMPGRPPNPLDLD
jgi:hypothetical protein